MPIQILYLWSVSMTLGDMLSPQRRTSLEYELGNLGSLEKLAQLIDYIANCGQQRPLPHSEGREVTAKKTVLADV